MSRRQDQSKFAHMVALLILHAEELGYEVTYGDVWAFNFHLILDLVKPALPEKLYRYLLTRCHKKGSWHYKRLAIDLNLFKDGVYLTSTTAHEPLGIYWESIDGTWGGRFNKKDGNHYSYKET